MTVASDRTLNNDADTARQWPTASLADDSVTSEKIAPGAVEVGDVADGSVTAAKLGALAVETAKLDAGAVTGAKITPTGVVSGSFVGVAAAGPCTLTGAAVGQRVLMIARVDTASGDLGGMDDFESVITVVDEIQQSLAGDLSLQTFAVVLLPAAA